MSRLIWNEAANKLYESGLDQGVFYAQLNDGTYPLGVPWEGLISISESPGGAEATDLYANNVKYASLLSAETFGGSIEAYTFPDEFMAADGSLEHEAGVNVSQQARTPFGLAYRTRIGSDAGGDVVGYKLHLVYGCKASPSESSRSTINDSPEAVTFSWDFTSTPVNAPGYAATSKIVIDTTKASAGFVTWLEDEIFGSDTGPIVANLPLPTEVLSQATALA